jgi:hypothetical protein
VNIRKNFLKLKTKWILSFLLLSACIERIDFDVPDAQFQMVIEGMISDASGPYMVKISRGLDLDADSLSYTPVENAKVKLYDDMGMVEDLVERSPGIYSSGGIIQGHVGHAYFIRIETSDGRIFESEPDLINPVGEVEAIRYEFEARKKDEDFGEVDANVFNIFVDAKAGNGDENYIRWKFTGTYRVLTNPELRKVTIREYTIMDPLPCSGYIVSPAPGGGLLTKVEECSCCTCWANHLETEPQLSDQQLISGDRFNNIKVAEIPINQATFFDKYHIGIEQMSLSRKAFEFFKLIRAQKNGSSSLFQSPSGEIVGNIHSVNSTEPVIGFFWATAVKNKSIFIDRKEVPYQLPPIYYVTDKCTNYYPNSSTEKPTFWE